MMLRAVYEIIIYNYSFLAICLFLSNNVKLLYLSV